MQNSKKNCKYEGNKFMNFSIRTIIGVGTKEAVLAGFTNTLFLRLAPPFPKLKLLRYDGCDRGNEIHIQLNFFLYKSIWVSIVTENGTTANEFYFIDEGSIFPAPIKSWKHRHTIRQIGVLVEIEDNVTYSCGSKGLDILLYIPFCLLMLYRKPIYKNFFMHN